KTISEYNREFLLSALEKKEGFLFNKNSGDIIDYIPDNSIKMIYFDPPFSSKNQNDIPHFQDRNSSDLSKFVWFVDNKRSFIKESEKYLRDFHRVLKEDGSIFLHLPWDLAYDIKPIADS